MSEICIGNLTLGAIPRVVAAISNVGAIADFRALPFATFNIAEIRLHPDPAANGDWKAGVKILKEHSIPTLLTLRIPAEGGNWPDDAKRVAAFRDGMSAVAAIDVELQSTTIPEIVSAAREQGVTTIGSFHNFTATPPIDQLLRLVDEAERKGVNVLKVATMVNLPEDVWTLVNLLGAARKRMPVCAIGMGSLGLASRFVLPSLGSCLTYGFLDSTTAPGQVSCARMTEFLRETAPGYRASKKS